MEILKRKCLKKVFSILMMATLVFNMMGLNTFTMNVKADNYITLYFVDNTSQKWIGNDSAVMELVDNTYGYHSYMMTKLNSTTWSASVPSSTNNITFNRYNSSKTEKWNSFSAGGRDGKSAYYAQGHEYGYWGDYSTGFKTGDVIYLDLSSFTQWINDGAMLYANFTSASKNENGGNDVNISSADKSLYQPVMGLQNVTGNIYKYVVTNANEGKSVLRFWRGNYSTLWNCSVALTYSRYASGYNCIKVTGWNNSGYVYKR